MQVFECLQGFTKELPERLKHVFEMSSFQCLQRHDRSIHFGKAHVNKSWWGLQPSPLGLTLNSTNFIAITWLSLLFYKLIKFIQIIFSNGIMRKSWCKTKISLVYQRGFKAPLSRIRNSWNERCRMNGDHVERANLFGNAEWYFNL